MADQNPAQPKAQVTPAPATTEQLLASTLAQLAESNRQITELMQQQAEYNRQALKIAPRRRKSMGEYLAEKKQRGAFKFLWHDVYQNGRPVNPSGLSQDTIDLLDTLRTGSYCDGLVDVSRIQDGPEGLNTRIHLMYNNGKIEERMVFYMRFPTFTKIVRDISAEMASRAVGRDGKPDPDSPYAPKFDKRRDPPEFEFPENL